MLTDSEARATFHALWGKAVGTADYDKPQWKALQAYLEQQAGFAKARGIEVEP